MARVFWSESGRKLVHDADRVKRRLIRCLPQVQINYLPEAGHGLVDCTLPILEYLGDAIAASDRAECSVGAGEIVT